MNDISMATWGLIAAGLSVTAVASAGVYEGFFVMPGWFANVPKSLGLIQNRKTVRFWIPLQILSIISLIYAAITNWHSEQLHTSLLVALISYGLVWVFTAVYFVPGVMRFSKIDKAGKYSAVLERQGKRWLAGSWARQVVMVVSAVTLLIALALA